MMTLPFGIPVAQRELDDLRNLFISDTNDGRFGIVLNENRCPIIGRRGTGKSALAELLQYEKPRTFAEFAKIELRPLFEQVLHEVNRAPERERTLSDAIAEVWTMLLWTAVMERLVKQNHLRSAAVSAFLGASQERGSAAQIVLDEIATGVCTSGGTLLDWSKRHRALEQRSYPSALEDTKNCLALMGKVAVIIDSFDDVPVKTPAMIAVTIGLLTAANSELHRNLSIKCFLPTEVWVHVRSKMPNVGHFEPFEMRWSPDDLIRLLASRLNRYLAEREMALATPSGEVHWHSPADVRAKVWDKVFPDPAQAPGSSHLEKPEQLILRHTQLRPRQAIRLCNQIAEVWKPTPIPDRPSRRDHYEATPFKPHHITAGIDGRLEHLCTEIVAAYVYIDEHVESALNHFSGGAAVKERMLIEAPESAWTLAYRIGAIGPVKSNSPSYSRSFSYYRAAEFEFCHREPVEWRPSTEEIAVHPLFYRRLGLTESLRTMVYMRGFWSPQPQPVETW